MRVKLAGLHEWKNECRAVHCACSNKNPGHMRRENFCNTSQLHYNEEERIELPFIDVKEEESGDEEQGFSL